MWEIPVYKQEVDDGIGHEVRSCSSLAYASLAVKSAAKQSDEPILKRIEKGRAENLGQLDLYYLDTLMVSTGWNLNDDVFDRSETWAARNTPEDKPFNYGHDENDIVGHITSCYAFGDDAKTIASIQAIDELPEKFHISAGGVLYKYKEEPEAKERINKLIAEIEEGKWFVSMECLFKNFDYAIIEPDGTQKVIARNEETSFLTKHLRAYKGTGKYEGKTVGRLMRNFVFSALALVQNPANPASVIFEKSKAFVYKQKPADVLGYKVLTQNNKESITMPETKILEDEIAQLKADKAQLEAKLKDYDSKAVATLELNLKAKSDLLSTAESEKLEALKSLETAKKSLEEANAKLNSVTVDLEKIQSEKRLADRITFVVEKLKMEKEPAAKLVASLISLNDENFQAAIAATPGYSDQNGAVTQDIKGAPAAVGRQPVKTPGAPVNPAMTTSPISEANPIAQEQLNFKGAAGTPEAIANAVPTPEAALAVDTGANDELQKVGAEIASFFDLEENQDN